MGHVTDENEEILVIGAGLGRTGTNSLKLALEIILEKPCYHLKDMCSRRRTDVPKWMEMERQLKQKSDSKFDPNEVRQFFKGYRAAVDHPICTHYKELMEVYPNAKIILTTRDPEIWLAGCRSTILPRDVFTRRPWSFYFLRAILGLKPFYDMYLDSWRRVFGPDMDFSDDNAMLNGFVAWGESVKKTVPADKLLVYDISKGWEPLCRFLDAPVPNRAFPHVNEYKELRRLIRLERRSTKVVQWGLPALLIFIVAFLIYQLWPFRS